MRTAEMNYADVVIPVATMYETDHPFEFSGNWIMARNKVIEPLGDYKSDYEFWIDLGVRMGYGKDFWNGSIAECMNDQLKPLDLTMEELRAKPTGIVFPSKPMEYEKYSRIFGRLSTRFSKAPYLPQGKVAIYNTTFEENGYRTAAGLGRTAGEPDRHARSAEEISAHLFRFSHFQGLQRRLAPQRALSARSSSLSDAADASRQRPGNAE